MEQILCLEVDVMGIMILMIMLMNIRKTEYSEKTPDQRLFGMMLCINIGLLVFDAGMWLLDKKQFLMAREIYWIDTMIYYLLNPAVCFVWLLYTDYKMNGDEQQLIKKVPIYSLPSIVIIIMTLTSPINGWLFYIDEQNHYTRGSLFWILPLLIFFYVVYAAYLTIKKIRQSEVMDREKKYRYMIEFPFLGIVGSVIQALFFGLPLIWNFTAIYLLIIFINFQNKTMMTDKLTDLYNRRYMDEYLLWKVQTIRVNQLLFAILIDVDRFKEINDKYGHLAGDQALRDVAQIIKKDCSTQKDLLVRMGGDEFLIIGERHSKDEIERKILSVQKRVKEFNSEYNRVYTLSLSIGYAIWGEEGIDTIDELISAADKKMYICKVMHHQ